MKTIGSTVDCKYDAAEGQAQTRLRSALQSLQSSKMGGGGGGGRGGAGTETLLPLEPNRTSQNNLRVHEKRASIVVT